MKTKEDKKSRGLSVRAAFYIVPVLHQMLVRFEATGAYFNTRAVRLGGILKIRLTAFGAGRVEFGRTGAVGVSSRRLGTLAACCTCLCHNVPYASRGRARCQSHAYAEQTRNTRGHSRNGRGSHAEHTRTFAEWTRKQCGTRAECCACSASLWRRGWVQIQSF